jgi:hypothetical protein
MRKKGAPKQRLSALRKEEMFTKPQQNPDVSAPIKKEMRPVKHSSIELRHQTSIRTIP